MKMRFIFDFLEDEYEHEIKQDLEEDQYEIEIKEELHEYPWVAGKIGDCKYSAKVYKETSDFGIDGSNISKLNVVNEEGKTIINYDRGWDVEPTNEYEKEVLQELIDKYEVDGDETVEEYNRENGILRIFFGR